MADDKEEEDDVDSGWDFGQSPALARKDRTPISPAELEAAVGLALDNLEDLETTVEVSSSGNTDLAQTVEAPALTREALQDLLAGAPIPSSSPDSAAVTVRGNVDSFTERLATPVPPADENEPPTRRASDEELVRARSASPTSPPMKLAGRRTTPTHTNAAIEAKKADARFQSRPTPRATAVATTALRFPVGSLVDARNRRKTTKISLETVDIARAEAEDAGKRKSPSIPVLDLHLPDAFEDALGATTPEDTPVAETKEKAVPPAVDSSSAPRPTSATARTAPAIPAALAKQGGKVGAGPAPAPPPTPPSSGKSALQPPRPLTAALRTSTGVKADVAKPPRPAASPVSISPLADTFDGLGEGDIRVDLAEAELSDEEVAAIRGSGPSSVREPSPPAPSVVTKRPIAVLDEPGEAVVSSKPVAPVETEDPQLTPIRVRFERGDYLGALLRAEALLEERPDFELARRYVESAQELLRQMYLQKLGSGDQVLRVAMDPSEIQGLTLDHRSGFLISLIDGVATVDEILDISGMPPLDALRLLFEMRQQGVVVIDSLAHP